MGSDEVCSKLCFKTGCWCLFDIQRDQVTNSGNKLGSK